MDYLINDPAVITFVVATGMGAVLIVSLIITGATLASKLWDK